MTRPLGTRSPRTVARRRVAASVPVPWGATASHGSAWWTRSRLLRRHRASTDASASLVLSRLIGGGVRPFLTTAGRGLRGARGTRRRVPRRERGQLGIRAASVLSNQEEVASISAGRLRSRVDRALEPRLTPRGFRKRQGPACSSSIVWLCARVDRHRSYLEQAGRRRGPQHHLSAKRRHLAGLTACCARGRSHGAALSLTRIERRLTDRRRNCRTR